MAWMMVTGGVVFASLVAALMLAEWMVWRARARKGLQWAENAPRRPARLDRS